MKNGLLNLLSSMKQKNIELRNEVNNDYRKFKLVSNSNNVSKITITDNSIIIEDGQEVISHDCINRNMIKSVLHTYLSRSMVNRTNAGRYDLFLFDNLDVNECVKYGYLEQNNRTTNKTCIVVCTSFDTMALIREELVSNFGYIVINSSMEKILSL